MKGKIIWPLIFALVFALSRIPGALSSDFANFSAAYALAFIAGVYFPRAMAWWFPLAIFVATDVALNMFYWLVRGYPVWDLAILKYQFVNYVAYAVIIWLGRRFKPQSSFQSLLGGGVLGAILFYLITNTASWLFNPFQNPEYTKNFSGWLIALIKGTGGWPETWQFFRNTLLSGGLFTGLFVAAMKATEESPADKVAGAREDEAPETEGEPEEAKA
ncbi:MAG: DUF6580 family putative transport protein [Verrucomicrobiota bacterium]